VKWDRNTQLLALAVVSGLGVIVYLYRNQLGVIVADQAEKYWPLPASGEPYRSIIQSAATDYGVPFDLIARDLYQESRFNPNAHNASGADGIAQLIPRFYPGVNTRDPSQAIPAQAQSLANYYDRFGTWAEALAAYDWGPGNVDNAQNLYGDNWLANAPTEARKYVGQILTDVQIEPLPVGALT